MSIISLIRHAYAKDYALLFATTPAIRYAATMLLTRYAQPCLRASLFHFSLMPMFFVSRLPLCYFYHFSAAMITRCRQRAYSSVVGTRTAR